MTYESLKASIRDIPDYPKPGIVFKDITTLLKDKSAFRMAQQALTERYRSVPVDLVAAVEARGFIFGGALALTLGCGFIPLRKPGKLPAESLSEPYALEYGTDEIHMHRDAVLRDQRVLLIDDLLATGGTLSAAARLVEKAGGVVAGIGVVIELAFLEGRHRLRDYDVFAVVTYDSE
ncbi:MAG: adenine phosphoribosyltransferase [candidate division Zixibacteria bacterium]|nr:adenine phosphoribosyltransferase [candidate division Zixibacteria bacterium]